MLRPPLVPLLAVGLVVGPVLQQPAHAAPSLSVTSPDDVLAVGSRLVFSTVNEETRPARAITVRNAGDGTLSVTRVAIGGTQASSFRFSSGQATSFSLGPGSSRQVAVEFRPTSTTGVESSATLTVSSSAGTRTVALAGLDAKDYEGSNEPGAQQIVRVLGYGTNIGGSTTSTYVSNQRTPRGDERISPYWTRADASRSVRVLPLARYVSRGATGQGGIAWHAKGSTTRTTIASFIGGTDVSGGQNQRLLPRVDGSGTFSTSSPFGLVTTALDEYSDDGRNGKVHNWRFYPAKNAAGTVIANAWIAAVDAATDPAYKNYDYQDNVFLLLNARPLLTVSPSPSSSAVKLDFSAARAGTVRDKDGQGTGFADVQPNAAGTQSVPSRIDLDTAAGRLRLTSSAGTNDGSTNTLQNALRLSYDGSRGRVGVTGRLVAPFRFSDDYQQAAVLVGPDQDNYLKAEVEYANGRLNIGVLYESRGTTPLTENANTFTRVPLAAVPTGGTVDLRITADPVRGTLQAAYRIGTTAAFTSVGPAVAPRDISRWFSTQARAAVAVSNVGAATAITATYDSFAVAPA